MGFDLQYVLSDERHYGIFECTICQNLVDLPDAMVTTVCHHTFCRSCLLPWLQQANATATSAEFRMMATSPHAASSPKCPTCNQDLLYSSYGNNNSIINNTNGTQSRRQDASSMMVGDAHVLVQPLSQHQPMAYRLLKRIQVLCPLNKTAGCSWRGDFGDLQAHLLSDSAHNHATDSQTLTPQHHPSVADNTADHVHNDDTIMDVDREDGTLPNGKADPSQSDIIDSKRPLEQNDIVRDELARHQHQMQQEAQLEVWRRCLLTAQTFKEQANEQYASGHYQAARDLYNKALSILAKQGKPMTLSPLHMQNPSAFDLSQGEGTIQQQYLELTTVLYCNRSAAHLALQDYRQAALDAAQALEFDPTNIKAYVRRARALTELGEFAAALALLQQAVELFSQSNNSSISSTCNASLSVLKRELHKAVMLQSQMTLGLQQLQNQEYAAAKATFGHLLRETAAVCVVLGAARADLGLGLTDSTLRLTMQALKRQDPQSTAEAYRIRGQCLLLMSEFDAAIRLLREALRLDPDADDTKAALRQAIQVQTKLKEARDSYFNRKFSQAIQHINSALQACGTSSAVSNTSSSFLPSKSPLFALLYSERARAYLRLKQFDAALKDCALVLYSREDDVDAWLIRFQALHGLCRHEEVLEEVSGLMKQWGSHDERIRKAYENADFQVRKVKRPDFYAMLGVPAVASDREIKKAYRQRALDLHPDRFVGEQYTDGQRKQAERDFQLLGQGLEILTDDFQRRLYDEGYDPEAIKERVDMAQRAAHSHSGNFRPHGRS